MYIHTYQAHLAMHNLIPIATSTGVVFVMLPAKIEIS